MPPELAIGVPVIHERYDTRWPRKSGRQQKLRGSYNSLTNRTGLNRLARAYLATGAGGRRQTAGPGPRATLDTRRVLPVVDDDGRVIDVAPAFF